MGIPENIDALLIKYDITQEALARIAEVEPSSVTRWRTGSQIRKANLDRILEYFGLSEDDILSSRAGLAAKEHGTVMPSGWVKVPLFGRIAAGQPLEMDNTNDFAEVPEVIASRYPDCFCLTVEGSSMDKVLPDGCHAVIEPCDTIERDNKPYAVCVNGYDATIKRVRKLERGFELAPDSNDPTFKPKVYDMDNPEDEEITVIGRVVYHVMPFDWEY